MLLKPLDFWVACLPPLCPKYSSLQPNYIVADNSKFKSNSQVFFFDLGIRQIFDSSQHFMHPMTLRIFIF